MSERQRVERRRGDGRSGAPESERSERLENNANNLAPAKRNSREIRYERRSWLWREAGLETVRKCGRVRIAPSVGLRVAGGVAGYSGLHTCGSVWACPVCASKVLARRSIEIAEMVEAQEASGGRLAMLTLTMRHKRGDSLTELWDNLAYAWHAVTGTKTWRNEKDRNGLLGWTKVVEVTQGRNGWHAHLHVLLYLEESPSNQALDAWQGAIFARWSRALQRRGERAPLLNSQDLHLIHGKAEPLAGYFAKAADTGSEMGAEMTHSAGKVARSVYGTETPWRLLDGAISDGDAEALGKWHEWERASRGRRQIAHSKGLRELLGLTEEVATDEEIAAEEVGTVEDETLVFDPEGWTRMVAESWLIPAVLTLAETEGLAAVRGLLAEHGVAHRVVCGVSPP